MASQLGSELARLGHRIHFISYEPPSPPGPEAAQHNLPQGGIERYRLFKYPDYTLPLAVEDGSRWRRKYELDILHVHYKVPHACRSAAGDADHARKQIRRAPHVITTLHGLMTSRAVAATAKWGRSSSTSSRALRSDGGFEEPEGGNHSGAEDPQADRGDHNFYRPKLPRKGRAEVRRALKVRADDFLLIHLSNLRPVKRVPDVLQVVADVKDQGNIKLLVLAGDSFAPFRPLVKRLGIEDRVIVKENVLDIENHLPQPTRDCTLRKKRASEWACSRP